jgi:endo-1,4-beta-xylanase
MKIKICTGIIILSIFVVFGCGSGSSEPVDPPPEYNDDIELHTKWPFAVGAAVPGGRSTQGNALVSGNPQYNLLKHFNVLVAENEMKPENIMPSSPNGQYNWTYADALVNYAEEHNKRIRGHVLIWHDQTPSWFFNGNKTQLYEYMERHIKTVFEKYGGKIDTWDVCNEVVDHNVYTNGGARSDSGYTRIMENSGLSGMNRYEYVLKAFQWARQYADANGGTNVKLYLTDYGVERPFTGQSAGSKQQAFKELVEWLIQNNAPIDGVGFQSHFRLYDHPVEQISEGIDMFAALQKSNGEKIKVQICELDIQIFSNARNEINTPTLSGSILNQRLADQAQTYRDFFDMFKTKYNEGKLDMVVVWGLADGQSWLNYRSDYPNGRVDYPLLFNRNYRGKEAYYKLVDEEVEQIN